jgi:glycosyltransferase involved in cell wall biosynthesis
MPPRHNGSAQCVLGFLDGFAHLAGSERIDVLVSREAAEFHGVARRYPSFGVVLDKPAGAYFAAIGLTQPWEMRTVAELHRHALLIAFTMLDTIGWDVLYPDGAAGLGRVWRFVARYADGLLYISQFTRDRFNARFPLDPEVAEAVTHLSLRQDEHVQPAAQGEPVNDHILIFGNEYDHKNLKPTVQLLADAFPFNRLIAFGIDQTLAGNVESIPSGELDPMELHRLIAGARVIVYPSLYEGFGLPVVEGMAYGRPVVVRRSALWGEIAGHSRLPGSLVEFDDAASLVDAVGRVLAGLPSCSLPTGIHLSDGLSPGGWRDSAARVADLLHDCFTKPASARGQRWRARDEALLLAGL